MFINDINALMGLKRTSRAEIARRLNTTAQNLGQKLNKDNIKDTEAKQVFKALGLDIEIVYTDRTTGEQIYKSKL